MSIVSVKNDTVTRTSVINASIPLAPVINSINILIASVIADDTAVDIAGGQTVQINGTGFISGAIITLGGSAVTTVYVSPNTLTFTAPAKTAATYVIYVLNPDGGTAIYIPGLVYSGTPIWTTTAISPASTYETNSIATGVLVTAGGDTPIVYTLASGTLPPGAVLNSSTGELTGTASATASNTTYTFTIKATDAQLQDSTSASFSLTINTDVVTMANTSVSLEQNTASNTALTATSAAGKTISYSSTALPAGLSIVGAAVTGTPTVAAVTTTTFTATAATTNRTGTGTITWTVSVAADQYVMYNTLLLSGAAATETFVTDASTNNFALTIAGDTKPNNFNPYTPGYYSNYFAANESLTRASIGTSIGTGDFSLECWVNVPVAANTYAAAIQLNVSTNYNIYIQTHSSQLRVIDYNNPSGSNFVLVGGAIISNTWYHLLLTRQSGTIRGFINGNLTVNQTAVTFNYGTAGTCLINSGALTNNISNLRVIVGNVPSAYQTSSVTNGTQIFTPSTTPLTNVSGTVLLTCQSNGFLDNSTSAPALTITGSPKIQSFTPFVPNTQYAAYGSTYFDGTTDYLEITNNAAHDFGSGDFSVEAWVYPTGDVAYSNVISKDNGNGAGWLFEYSATRGLFVAWASTNISSAGAYVKNSWSHLVFSRSGTTVSIYRNGARLATATSSASISSANNLRIGAVSGVTLYEFPGYISNVRVVKGSSPYDATQTTITVPTAPLTAVANTSLLTCQTNQPVSNSMFLDSSTNALAITRAGNTSAGTFSPYGANWSNYFDGASTSYIQTPAGSTTAILGASGITATSTFTIECWIYQIQRHTALVNPVLIGDQGVNGSLYWTFGPDSAGKLAFYHYTGTTLSATGNDTIPLNTWTHIAVSINSGVIKLFVNGYLQTITGTSTTGSQSGGFGYLLTGGFYSFTSTHAYIGNLSNLRIVKSALYATAFTPSTAPLAPITNTGLLMCQSSRVIDNSPNAFTLTTGSTLSVQRFSPFSPQTQTPITHSAYFDGSGDYLTVPSNAALGFGAGDFTVECWIYRTDTGVQRGIVDSTASAGTRILFFITGNGNLNLFDGTSVWLTSTNAVAVNQWVHVAAVRISGTTKLFINGAQEASVADARNYAAAVTYIGRQYGTTINDFLGYISNVRMVKGVAVYTGAFTVPTSPLTAVQSASGAYIAAITGTQTSLLTLQSPTFVDNSTNNFTLTAFDNAKPRTINPFGFTSLTAAYSAATYGASAYFDTSGDSISPPQSSIFNMSLGNWTAEAWFYSFSINSGNARYITFAPSAGSTFGIIVLSGNFGLNLFGSSNAISTSIAATLNAWQHVALVKNGATTTLYINGVAGGSGTPAWVNASTTVYFGTNVGTYADNYNGYIASARVVMGTAVYTSNFVPPAAPLTAITNTSLLLNMNSAGVYDSASMNDLETVADAKRVSTHTPYAGSYYSNYFDGSGDYLTTIATGIIPATNTFTIECWVYSTSYGDRGIVAQSAGGAGRLILSINSSGNVNFQIGGTTLTTTGYAIGLNQWTHIAVTRVVSAVTVYFNGVSVATGTNATSVDNVIVTIGVVPTYSQYWIGYISNIRIVNGTAVYTGSTFAVPTAPLTAITNTSLLTCQSNRFVDKSTNSFAITKYDNTSVQSFNPFQRNIGTTLYFDGTGDALVIPYNPVFNFGVGNFTIEFWTYVTATPSTEQYFLAVGPAGSGNANRGWRIAAHNGTAAGIYFCPLGIGSEVLLGSFPNASAWHHIAIVRNSTTITGYVDGIALGTTINASTTAITDISSGDYSFVGGLNSSGATPRLFYNGYINDLRITKGVARYTSNFTPPTTAFIAR